MRQKLLEIVFSALQLALTGLFSFPCFIMRGWLADLVLSSVRFLSLFYLFIKCGAITDTFLSTIRHRVVWMRPQLLHVLLSQTKLHLQFLSGIPKEKSNLNISDIQQSHTIQSLSSMSFAIVLQCCQRQGDVLTVTLKFPLSYTSLSFPPRKSSLATKQRWMGLLECQQDFPLSNNMNVFIVH